MCWLAILLLLASGNTQKRPTTEHIAMTAKHWQALCTINNRINHTSQYFIKHIFTIFNTTFLQTWSTVSSKRDISATRWAIKKILDPSLDPDMDLGALDPNSNPDQSQKQINRSLCHTPTLPKNSPKPVKGNQKVPRKESKLTISSGDN